MNLQSVLATLDQALAARRDDRGSLPIRTC